MQAAQDLVRKSQFAEMRRVSPGRVSQWIAEGKIGPEAIVGEGQRAQIRVSIADRHLKERLDVTQRFGLNGIFTNLEGAAVSALTEELPIETPPSQHDLSTASPSALASPPKPKEEEDTTEAKIKREKLKQQQLATRRAEEAERLSRGEYVLAAAAQQEMGKMATAMLKAVESVLSEVADDLAEQFNLPVRDVQHKQKLAFNKARQKIATELKLKAECEPEIFDDIADEE